jgi:hypothetical protein
MSAPRKINERLTEWKGKARVEQGPALKKAKATRELLHNSLTADHYQEGLRDARGKPIKVGDEMHYLDHLAPHGFYVYEHQGIIPVTYDKRALAVQDGTAKAGDPVIDPSTGKPMTVENWVEVGYFDSYEEAEAKADEIASGK